MRQGRFMSWSPTTRLLWVVVVGVGTRLPRRVALVALGPLCLFHPHGPLDEVRVFFSSGGRLLRL